MANAIAIDLLGTFAVRSDDGTVLNGFSNRQQSLLAYLLLNQHVPQSRQQVAFLFWPESSDRQAKTNLRQLLYHLRQSWPAVDTYIQASVHTLQWNGSAPCAVDVFEFQARLERAAHAPSPAESCRLLEEAVAAYPGDLLPACYDDWIEPLRQELRGQFLIALEKLVADYEMQGSHAAAIRWAEQRLRHDPLHEESYSTLMRLHALLNNRATALRIYQRCVTILREELGVDPSPATREQYKRILNMTAPAVTQTAHAPVSAPTAPLFGRGREWAELHQVWQATQQGQAQIALVYGEAGIGKTRLLEEFARWAGLQGAQVAQTQSYAAQGQLTYAPVTAWLRSDAFFRKLSHLDDVWISEISRLLPELLTEHPTVSPPHPILESWQRERFYEGMARAFVGAADGQLCVLILDDLQWSGAGVLEWFSYLLHFAAQMPLLIVGAVRSGTIDAQHPLQGLVTIWRQEQVLTEIRLHPLGTEDSSRLANHITGSALTAEEVESLYRVTEGNPFFIVETVRAALEQSNQPDLADAHSESIAAVSLPPKVQAMIESRLNQLSTNARELAEYAAVTGREFSFEVLAQAKEQDEEALVHSLDELWQRQIVREQGAFTYDFSHDKIREVVYSRISQARRRLLHRRIAEALLRLQREDATDISAQLARHYEHAHLPEQAIAYYQKAAEVAQRVYANAEVIALLTRALDLLHTLPAGRQRNVQELSLRVALSAPLVALTGYNTPAVTSEYQQVLRLCQELDQPPDPRALRGLAIANILQARFDQSWHYGQQIIALVQSEQDSVLFVEGHYVLGVSAFWCGRFAQARFHLEEALNHYSAEQRMMHISTYAQDPGIICLTRLAWTLWYLGYPDQAYALMDHAVNQEEHTTHPFSQGYALAFACMLYEDADDARRLQEQTERLGELAEEANFFYLRNWAAFHRGWIVGLNGDYAESARQIRQVINDWHAEQTYLLTPRMYERLAVAYWRSGHLSAAAAALEEAWSAAQMRNEVYFLSELSRMRGEFVLAQGGSVQEAAAHFQAAADLACRQQAKILELRALVSLCRLWQDNNDPVRLAAAKETLQIRYDWFSEGFASADLQAASSLLKEVIGDS